MFVNKKMNSIHKAKHKPPLRGYEPKLPVHRSRSIPAQSTAEESSHTSDSDTSEEQEEEQIGGKKRKKEHRNIQNESNHSSNSSSSSVLASSNDSSNSVALTELRNTGRHFSKIAARFSFEDTTASYMNWHIQFRAEMDNYELSYILDSDPTVDTDTSMDATLYTQQQKTVYHMILQCVSKEKKAIIITGINTSEHTGYHAWHALRLFYVGDEQAYLQSLEKRFMDMKWEENELFPTFESRYESLLSELENAGAGKLEHVKKSGFMQAIEESTHKDVRGVHVFDRLNVVSKIHLQQSFREWMTAIRIEAQQIQEAMNKNKGTKRNREGEEKHAEVSFVATGNNNNPSSSSSSAPATAAASYSNNNYNNNNNQRPFLQVKRNYPSNSKPHCRNMQRFGRCSFGTTCRFSHDIPVGGLQQQQRPFSRFNGNNNNYNNNNMRGNRNTTTNHPPLCFDYQSGRCTRGSMCRFSHSRSGNDGVGMNSNHHAAAPGEAKMSELAVEMGDMCELTDSVDDSKKGIHRVIIDSGASYHITPHREFIHNIRALPAPLPIRGAFGQPTFVTHAGEGKITMGENVLHVKQLLLCVGLRDTLLSYVLLLKDGHRVNSNSNGGIFVNKDSTFAMKINLAANIMVLYQGEDSQKSGEANVTTRGQMKRESEVPAAASNETHAEATEKKAKDHLLSNNYPTTSSSLPPPITALHSAHIRYGHLCGRKLAQLSKYQAAAGLDTLSATATAMKDLITNCDACMQAKMSRIAFSSSMIHSAEAPNDKIVADVLTITIRQADKRGAATKEKYFVSIITDVYSRNCNLRVLVSKDEASDHVISYFHRARIVTGRELKHFHTDGGLEYNKAEKALEMRGVKVTRTPIHTSQRNAIAERKNRTLVEMMRTFLQHANLNPQQYWQAALETAVFTHNRVTVVSERKKTQHELFTGVKPNLSFLHGFGCDAFVRDPTADTTQYNKVAAKAYKGIFIGYDMKRELCYRIQLENGKIIVSRDVKFIEEKFTVGRNNNNNSSNSNTQIIANSNRNSNSNRIIFPTGTTSSDINNDEKNNNNDNNSSESDSDNNSDSDNSNAEEDEDEVRIDERTAKKIAIAQAKEKNNNNNNSNRKSSRTRKPAKQTGLNLDDFGRAALQLTDDSSASSHSHNSNIRSSDVEIPSTRKAALRSAYSREWQQAMDKEIQSIRDHGTYVLVQKPDPQVNIVSCKWVFAVKSNKHGFIDRFKARLVARGFTQQYGVDYTESYSPVLRYKTLRVLLTLVAHFDLNMELMDVQTAYLNASLKETVYMQQPEGYLEGNHNTVCLLLKALYGLKQSGREWHTHLNEFILSLGFTRCVSDTCVYVKRSRTGNMMILSVYVDDIPSGHLPIDELEWQEIKQAFYQKFKIKFVADADWILNMRITRDRKKKLLWLDQEAYIDTMLEDLQFDQCKISDHPGAPEELSQLGNPSTEEEARMMKMIPYRRAIGLLTYLSNTSRPDIAHAVNLCAQYSQNPGAIHWRAVKQILRYCAGTSKHALMFDGQTKKQQIVDTSYSSSSSPSSLQLAAFSDSNWGNCPDTRRSTTGFILSLGGCWIDWNTHKQVTVALSSCEAEYMALCAATQAIMWMRNLLKELGINFSGTDSPNNSSLSVPLYCDNKSAIAMGKNDIMHNRSKHIDIKYHFIREQIEKGTISIQWISTQQQIADIFTKTLAPRNFIQCRDKLVHKRKEQQ
jgi:hypothetical protein